jgi:hypothetical protein
MKRILLPLVTLAACWSEGPTPTLPSGATTVFWVPRPTQNECSTSIYIADVALATDVGYTLTLPYSPNNCNNNGGMAPQIDVPVYSFNKTTGEQKMLGLAGRSNNGNQPRVAAYGSAAAWAYVNTSNSGVAVNGQPALTANIQQTMGFYPPVAMTADATRFYVAGLQTMNFSGKNMDVDDPTYPCCGPIGSEGGITSQVYAVAPTGASTTLPLAPKLNHRTLKNAMTSNATSLFFVENGATTAYGGTITRANKDGTGAMMLANASQSGVVAGFGASDALVAWSVSVAYEDRPYPAPFCSIAGWDLVANKQVGLLDSGDYACMDAAVDATHVYFTIVDVPDVRMEGLGIGRVNVKDGTVETLRTGIAGDGVGARRVYLDGDDIYAVDPFVIAKIPKSALDGKHDF